MNATKTFSRIRDDVFDFFVRESPTLATYLGIHNRDTQLTAWSKDDVSRREKEVKKFLGRLMKVDAEKLNIEDRIDYELISGTLKTYMATEKRLPTHSTDPGAYLDFGLYILTEREFASAETRARSILGRLKKIPRTLDWAKENLSNPPKVFTEGAILSTRGQIAFLEGPLKRFVAKARGRENADLRQELKKATERAISACKDYLTYLEETLLPNSRRSYAIGKSLFNFILKHQHQLDITADYLLTFGRRKLWKIKKELASTAKEISARKSWEKIVDELKRDHPRNEELVSYYASEMKRARDFVKRKELVTFPQNERLKVVETPDFAKPMIPYAAYLPPAPFEKEKLGIFWVTCAPKDADRKQINAQLEGHPRAGIVITSLHEAYPGHHLQLSLAAYHPDKIRHVLRTSVFVEGWALYCEELMWKEGFYDDPKCRLLQLKDELWRACRVIVDVSLHTGTMSFDDAVRFMVKEAKLEEVNAITEVRRYCHSPTQPMSYLLGKTLILKLLEDYKKAKGPSFELRRFHDDLLSHGSIPIKHIRKLLGIPN